MPASRGVQSIKVSLDEPFGRSQTRAVQGLTRNAESECSSAFRVLGITKGIAARRPRGRTALASNRESGVRTKRQWGQWSSFYTRVAAGVHSEHLSAS